MKTRLLVVTVLCLSSLLMACQPLHPLPSANPAPVLTAHEQANLTVVQNLYQALTRGNIAVLTGRWQQNFIKQLYDMKEVQLVVYDSGDSRRDD